MLIHTNVTSQIHYIQNEHIDCLLEIGIGNNPIGIHGNEVADRLAEYQNHFTDLQTAQMVVQTENGNNNGH